MAAVPAAAPYPASKTVLFCNTATREPQNNAQQATRQKRLRAVHRVNDVSSHSKTLLEHHPGREGLVIGFWS